MCIIQNIDINLVLNIISIGKFLKLMLVPKLNKIQYFDNKFKSLLEVMTKCIAIGYSYFIYVYNLELSKLIKVNLRKI